MLQLTEQHDGLACLTGAHAQLYIDLRSRWLCTAITTSIAGPGLRYFLQQEPQDGRLQLHRDLHAHLESLRIGKSGAAQPCAHCEQAAMHRCDGAKSKLLGTRCVSCGRTGYAAQAVQCCTGVGSRPALQQTRDQ